MGFGQRLKPRSFSGNFGMPEGTPWYESQFRNARVPHLLESSMLQTIYLIHRPNQRGHLLPRAPLFTLILPHCPEESSTCGVH
jgi:hypothetical protein